MGVVIALVSKVGGVNNLNLTTTRGDRLIEARPPRCGRLRAGFHQATSYTKPWGTNAAALVHELIEARDEKRLLRLQRQLAKVKLLIIDELGYVPLSPTGAELLFETFSQRYERSSIIVTSNLPFDEWTSVFGNERLTGALLDRLTHHVHILEFNGESYRLKSSKAKRRQGKNATQTGADTVDPNTGEITTT
jgi:chromosomal replication initiation ATPase DnaA